MKKAFCLIALCSFMAFSANLSSVRANEEIEETTTQTEEVQQEYKTTEENQQAEPTVAPAPKKVAPTTQSNKVNGKKTTLRERLKMKKETNK